MDEKVVYFTVRSLDASQVSLHLSKYKDQNVWCRQGGLGRDDRPEGHKSSSSLCLKQVEWITGLCLSVMEEQVIKHKGVKVKPSTGCMAAFSSGLLECHYSVLNYTLLHHCFKDVYFMFCVGIY